MANVLCMLMMMVIFGLAHFCDSLATNSTTFCAGKPNGVYANPQSCASFWACWDNGLKGSLLLCPPNTLWHQPSLTCTHFNSTHTPLSTSSPSSPPRSNTSIAPPSHNSRTLCQHRITRLHLPIWSWDGLLHCYGYGCLTNTKSSHGKVDVGIPCKAAHELISIAKGSKEAWMLAPQEFSVGKGGGQHWKVRFDAVEGETLLKASIIDYSPAQMIKREWQGGATGVEPLQVSLTGPKESTSGCYYNVALETPAFEGMWDVFARNLVKESLHKINKGSTQQANMAPLGGLFLPKSKKNQVHTNIQECLRSIPWASLVATALCYASNAAGGLQSMSLCFTDVPTPDLFTIAKCFTSLLHITTDLGL